MNRFINACKMGHLREANKYLDHPAMSHNVMYDGLCLASKNNRLNIVNRLLEFQSMVNVLPNNGNAVIYKAVEAGNEDIVNRLLGYERVVQHLSDNNNSLLRVSVNNNHHDITHRLMDFESVRLDTH